MIVIQWSWNNVQSTMKLTHSLTKQTIHTLKLLPDQWCDSCMFLQVFWLLESLLICNVSIRTHLNIRGLFTSVKVNINLGSSKRHYQKSIQEIYFWQLSNYVLCFKDLDDKYECRPGSSCLCWMIEQTNRRMNEGLLPFPQSSQTIIKSYTCTCPNTLIVSRP